MQDINKNLSKHIPTLISLWRKNGKNYPLNQQEIKTLSTSLVTLQRGLTGERKLAGQSYMSDKNLFGAYLLYYFPVSYLQIQTVVEALETTNIENKNNVISTLRHSSVTTSSITDNIKILEIGSGPAPGTVAILDKIREKNPNAKVEITLLDSSKNALETAKKIIESDFKNVKVTTKVCNLETINNCSLLITNYSFSIILLSHVLNELWKTDSKKIEKRIEFLKNVKNLLSDDGILILNEPAVLEASRNLIKVRDEILNNEDFKELSLISPCQSIVFSTSSTTENKKICPCLLSENATCHAEKDWTPIEPIFSMAKNAKLDRQSVKMTYFVFRKSTAVISPLRQSSATANSITNEKFTVVSDAMLNKSGRIRFMLCDGNKRFSLSAKKDDERAKKIGFFELKRYDKIEIKNPEIREENFGIKEDTAIIIN